MFYQIYITMKKLFLLLAMVGGLLFVSCEGFELNDDNEDPNEQPGSNPDDPDNSGGDNDDPDDGGDGGDDIPADKTQAIKFQDENTKLLCTLHWDANEDEELSYEEAAAVTDLGTAFKDSSILAFTELKYFTSLEKIGGDAFAGCTSLTSITIPNSVTEIGDNAFNSCTSLTSITIPDGVTKIDRWAFFSCTSLTSITIGNGVIEIGREAFYGCTSLTSITIPDSVTSIGWLAFAGCSSLTSITIPDSVTKIDRWAFNRCTSLTEVYCKPTTPPTGAFEMFDDNASGRKIYVPRASVDAYKAAEYWSDYADDIVGYDF